MQVKFNVKAQHRKTLNTLKFNGKFIYCIGSDGVVDPIASYAAHDSTFL